jgi:type IV secretion system protein VirB5
MTAISTRRRPTLAADMAAKMFEAQRLCKLRYKEVPVAGTTFIADKVDNPADSPLNPWIAAKHEWNERYGGLISRARNWRVAALLALLLALVEAVGLIGLSLRSKTEPFIVAVDSIGHVVAAGNADQAPVIDDRMKRAALYQWVQDLRMVISDPLVERRSIDRVYSMIGQGTPAQMFITNWYRDNTPFDRARTETVTVDVSSVLPTSNRSYEVEWTETSRDHSGAVAGTQNWKGVFTIAVNPPTDEKLAHVNPLGIYVVDASWSKVM